MIDAEDDFALFEGPKLKVLRAIKHISELHQVLHEYGHRLTVEHVSIDGDPDHKRISITEPLPREISYIVGDVAHNLRSALDLLILDIARMRAVNSNQLTFLFAGSLKAFDKRILTAPFDTIGDDVNAMVRQYQGFNGQETSLQSLHQLNIVDKHKIVVQLSPMTWGKGILESLLEASEGFTHLNIAIMGDLPSLSPVGSIIPTEHAYKEPYHPRRTATVFFAPAMPFANQHVVPCLQQVCVSVARVIEQFEQAFGDSST